MFTTKHKGGSKMVETLQKMISDGERIANLFETLTESDKNIVLVYMSAFSRSFAASSTAKV